ncbi:FAD binding domain-containing protein [Pseudonocardia sp. H11422]|uniref:FAD binding domain-containing protein n=1 Tax=Pseudonocardia sp. H11422 TaxID=2835866 RepID=UPI001BDD9356|nr:xanthine dehydrogenase family protein subunit M [Pseudonocardia sp. H11422]
MKPPPVLYHRATSTADAVQALAAAGEGDGEAKVLAGGQSLIPLMSMRLARPSTLVDINGLAELDYIRREGGRLRIGALTRHRTVELSPEVRDAAPLLAEAMRFVGHVPIRHRGTIGGSAAHSDPAAEIPAVLTALDAELVINGPAGVRTVTAADFFIGFLATLLEPDELLTEIRVPVQPAGTSCAVEELARRHGDFAIVAVFAALVVDGDGRCSDARLGVAGANPAPLRAREAEAALVGTTLTDEVIDQAAAAVAAATESVDDIHAPAAYRRDMAALLTGRALRRAASGTNAHPS